MASGASGAASQAHPEWAPGRILVQSQPRRRAQWATHCRRPGLDPPRQLHWPSGSLCRALGTQQQRSHGHRGRCRPPPTATPHAWTSGPQGTWPDRLPDPFGLSWHFQTALCSRGRTCPSLPPAGLLRATAAAVSGSSCCRELPGQ